jgi:xylulokinase
VTLVCGVDSSTQSCKVVVCDAASGEVVRQAGVPHPAGTEVDPWRWWDAMSAALGSVGTEDVAAMAVAAQQHGAVCLDGRGEVVRPALLWNDTRSAPQATELVEEMGGEVAGTKFWADAVGSVPVASFTITKLRWIAEHEPHHVARTAAVCLPHDWLTWRLACAPDTDTTTVATSTDRADASGTGYFSPASGAYRLDLLERAFGKRVELPVVRGPHEVVGTTADGALLGPGTGDNAAAALALGASPGDVIVSIGTSGTVFAVSEDPVADASGLVAGFADATGRFLPLIATLNAARVLDATAALLGVSRDEFSALALSAAPGSGGLSLVPYFEGERTPNKPFATGALHRIRLDAYSRENLARAAVEGILCALADGLDALVAQNVRVARPLLIGGGSRLEAVRRIAPSIFGRPVVVSEEAEYVAIGAARQAAWVLSGGPRAPEWTSIGEMLYEADPAPEVRARYAEVRELTASSTPERAR